ncbi:MAG: FtsW/RodA/SpoVE family cell cycle protein, partial [Clostridia bacterium]|nr:FtsW/RodA/SpoVE family cell cycle protein [Clostridia bacterium]
LAQSLMAFGSGGLFGMGLGRGRQKYSFLPYPESDFIFAIVGEDMGFIGCLLVMGLFMAFLFLGFRISLNEKDRFKSMLGAGIVLTIGVQTVLNIFVVTGIMPTTGLPLPFFSAGGTSVSIVMGAVGILFNISSEQDRL